MGTAWPWLAVAGIGALHGLNPATGGWLAAAGWGARARDDAHALRAVVPIAVGHFASVAAVAGAVLLGLSVDRLVWQCAAAALLALVAIVHFRRRRATLRRSGHPTGYAALGVLGCVTGSGNRGVSARPRGVRQFREQQPCNGHGRAVTERRALDAESQRLDGDHGAVDGVAAVEALAAEVDRDRRSDRRSFDALVPSHDKSTLNDEPSLLQATCRPQRTVGTAVDACACTRT